MDFDNFGLRGGSKSGKKWYTEWFDEIETSFNRFVVIINLGIDTQKGMVAINYDFDHFGFRGGPKSGKKWQKWHTGWSDELETLFNRFIVIENL
jgi:hypothetical protein